MVVGEILRKKREELGLDLRPISETLKIKYDYLKAIEEGAFDRLPADVYVKGYIHEYSKFLHLNPETILQTYIQQTSSSNNEKEEPTKKVTLQGRRFKLTYILIPLLLLISFIVITQTNSPLKKAEIPVSSPPEPKRQIITQKENTPYTLEIYADDITWLSVMIDETNSKELLMQPGDSVKWNAKNCFSLKIGNAGGVRLVFNGKKIEKLGEKGQVVKINLPDVRT